MGAAQFTVRNSAIHYWLLLLTVELAGAGSAPEVLPSAVTNLAELRRVSFFSPSGGYAIRLEGVVWWANAREGRLVLKDDSGAEELELELAGQALEPGQQVRLEGHGTIAQRGGGIQIGAAGPVVDNDGVHGMIERAGSVYLSEGRHPLRVDWFNGVEKYGLKVECEGPGRPRQPIADTELFRASSGEASNALDGMEYRCYEGTWEALPDFGQMSAVKTGTVSNFDLGMIPQEEHVGVRFTGFFRAPREGFYTFFLTSDDGSRLVVGEPTIRATVLGKAPFPEPKRIAVGQPLTEGESGQWAAVEGKVLFLREQAGSVEMELNAGAGRLRVELADAAGFSAARWSNVRVRATGFCESAKTITGQTVPGALLVPSCEYLTSLELPARPAAGITNAGGLPLLTRASEVHQLKREEAQRGYPVRIRGVVTCVLPERQAFTLEDSTRGLYVVDASPNRLGPPRLGEYLEVEGTTDPSLFAPIVNAQLVRSLGAGALPEPVHPTWDQLLNGSLDAQYVELQGIITGVLPGGVTLRTRGGSIQAHLRVTGLKPEDLQRYQDALVRIRGCLLALWDYVTHQVKLGEVRIYDADIIVDQPAPADLFSSPRKTAAEFLLFDPQASEFQRVKVSGQILHVREAEYFMMGGGHGLRFMAKNGNGLKVGDEVEVVGFPELSGSASPVLREAVARKVGQAALPEPRKLRPEELVRAENDATLVRVEGLLAGKRRSGEELVLELQSGVRNFVARLEPAAESARTLPIGARLELAGVYAGQGGNLAAGQDLGSFELLLNSASDIRVMARPPWWTLQRLLVIVGALISVLAITVLWLTQLHRQVDERTVQLEAQIRERQRVEHQRAMEQERTRIAQDLHDELGSGMTEISMLAVRAKSATAPDEKRSSYLQQMGDKAREMVAALDEIVWAMNPGHDSLASLVSYFSLYAERFLGLANITWRLEGPAALPEHVVNSHYRHQLFLAFKEALTNIVRHSGATEVRLAVQVLAGELRLSVSDNGRGMPAGAPSPEMDGVANMRARLQQLGGRSEIISPPGQGTTIRFYVPQPERL